MDDRRALLRRQLLKEQLSQESQAPAQKDVSQMTPDEIAAADEKARSAFNYKEIAPILAGAAQGSTMGFSDELGATKDVLVDALNPTNYDYSTPGLSPAEPKIVHTWREYQKQREAVNKALQEESPGKYMLGELGGGLVSAALMPSIGGAKIAAAGAEIAPGLGRFLAGEGGNLAARLAGKAATGVIEGAPVGAAYGAGSSENDLSKPLELGADIASGAGMGSITGAGLAASAQAGKAALKGASNIVGDSRLFRHMKEAYNFGKEGVNLGSSNTQDKLSLLPNEMGKSLVDKITAIDSQIGQKVGDSITNAQKQGIKINIDPKLAETGNKMFQTLFVENPTLGKLVEPKTGKLLQAMANNELGDLTPIEAKAMRDNLYKLSDDLGGYNTDTANFAKGLGKSLASTIDKSLKTSIPEYQAAAKEFETFRRMVPETIMNKGTPSEYSKVFMGNLKNPELKLFDSSKDMLKNAQMPGMANEAERSTFQQLGNNMSDLEKTNPEAVKQMGGNATDVMAGLKKQSDRLGMIRQAQGQDPHAALGKLATGQIFGFAPTAAGQGMSIANKIGRAVGSVNESAPVKMGSELFSAGNDKIMALSQKLKGSPSTAMLGDALENALNSKSEVAKHAVLFKMMQDPNYREMLRSEGLTGQEQ